MSFSNQSALSSNDFFHVGLASYPWRSPYLAAFFHTLPTSLYSAWKFASCTEVCVRSREVSRPLGSPTRAVAPPTRDTAWWPWL